jgi:hypothetical protein
MRESYLEVTFRHGRPLAAYLHLPRDPGERSVRTQNARPGIIVDIGRSGKPIGIELTAPMKVSLAALNEVLRDLGLPPLNPADLEPLRAA